MCQIVSIFLASRHPPVFRGLQSNGLYSFYCHSPLLANFSSPGVL
jgi:hypothetical protein